MSIKNKLYLAFSLVLGITLFIIGIFFYATITLSEIQKLQNHRFEQIRRVERIKELNTSFDWLVLDIIIDRKKKDVVKERQYKANLLFEKLWNSKTNVISNSEKEDEKNKLITIFKYFTIMQKFIEVDLEKLVLKLAEEEKFHKFNDKFSSLSLKTQNLVLEEIKLLQNKLNKTEKEREEFISRVKLELLILVFIAFSLAFIISTKLIRDIKLMLKKLNNGILYLLSNKEQSIMIDIKEGNELSEITANFNKYLEKKDDIINSREELLRNISHELKTPITKGKFLLEKLKYQDTNTLKNINQVFFDIEQLTSKLLERERLNFAHLNISSFHAVTLIAEALSKLSIEDESQVDILINDDFKINGDFYYLTIAMKNLIDNALKYCDTFPINIVVSNNHIYVKNNAKKLSKNFVYYIQPFTREPNQQTGHGLGLNIVSKIIELHNLSINYSYKNKQNIFHITF